MMPLLRYIENKSPPMDYPLLDIPGLINDPKDVKEYILSIENKLVNEKKLHFQQETFKDFYLKI